MDRSSFGSYSRAGYGCIVTFRMPDGSTEVKHFSSIFYTKNRTGRNGPRVEVRDVGYVDQAIEWADENGAKIISICTPETILRDLQGTRALLDPRPVGKGREGLYGRMQKHAPDLVHYPEKTMLRKRTDLFEAPRSALDTRVRRLA